MLRISQVRPTCGDDMEDAGRGHAADVVGGPAEDGAVVHLRAGPVAKRAASLTAVHQSAVQLSPLGRVVERPREAHLRRVRRDVTQDGGHLPLADAEDELQARLADRGDCGRVEVKEGRGSYWGVANSWLCWKLG